MTVWDEYFARWDSHLARTRHSTIWAPQAHDEFEQMGQGILADSSTHGPPSSPEDITWFKNALAREESKFFAAWILGALGQIPGELYEPMLRAAVNERDPSRNNAFVRPCVQSFGGKRVNETLLEWFENGSDREKAGAVQALYHVGLISTRADSWLRPGYDEEYKVIGDLWMRQRCLMLREFVNNPSVLVRQRIISHLELKDSSSYPEEFRPLVGQAIQIAKHHDDGYIRRRLELQMGAKGTQLFRPLPAINQTEREVSPGSERQASTAELVGRNLALRIKTLITRLRGG